jgi:hypothetical protein
MNNKHQSDGRAMKSFLILAIVCAIFNAVSACRCHIPLDEPLFSHVKSPLPHTYLRAEDLPDRWDWRNVNGTNFCNKVMTQQNPHVCGSCWAEAATGKILLFYDMIQLLNLIVYRRFERSLCDSHWQQVENAARSSSSVKLQGTHYWWCVHWG